MTVPHPAPTSWSAPVGSGDRFPSSRSPGVQAPSVPFSDVAEHVVPALSVCIAVRDRPLLLVKSIQSALAGSFQDFEVIVVDDGSVVPARDALIAAGLLRDQRIRLVRQAAAGIAAARNTALRAARGKYITVLDSDDEVTEDGLHVIQQFITSTGAHWIYTDYQEIVGDTSKIVRLPSYTTAHRMLWSVMIRPRLPFKHSGMTIKRDLLLKLGGYDERMPIKVDVELVLRALSRGIRPIHLARPVVRFYRHRGSISRRRFAGLSVWVKLISQYRTSRIPGVTLGIVAFRSLSEIGKWLMGFLGR